MLERERSGAVVSAFFGYLIHARAQAGRRPRFKPLRPSIGRRTERRAMLPPALLRIVMLVRAVGRSSAFVSVSSQAPSSIPIDFAAAALTAVLSPPPDDRSVQY